MRCFIEKATTSPQLDPKTKMSSAPPGHQHDDKNGVSCSTSEENVSTFMELIVVGATAHDAYRLSGREKMWDPFKIVEANRRGLSLSMLDKDDTLPITSMLQRDLEEFVISWGIRRAD